MEYDRNNHNLSGHIKGSVDGLKVDQDVDLDVGGNLNAQVGGDAEVNVDGGLTADVGADAEVTTGGDVTVEAGGGLTATAAGDAMLEALSITLQSVGDITINSDANVFINGLQIRLNDPVV